MPLRYCFMGPRSLVERPPGKIQSAGASDSLAGSTLAQSEAISDSYSSTT
jgi:hypothetical protein